MTPTAILAQAAHVASPPTIPELLAPAGTPDKLQTALHFGADAVYLGLKALSLRTAAGNFSQDELQWALSYAHERGRRVYVALNIQPLDSDLDAVVRTLGTLRQLQPDGLIVADPGVVALARQHAPALPLHLSTQASVTNAAAARFWIAQGVRRIILARELSLDQLAALSAGVDGELEAFVHGAVCIAWSGRCLLSLYWADRDPRRGACAQGCRWRYRFIEDARRPGELNPVEEDERGTYFFDAKDLCALPLLPELVDTGVRALKIEGRTRSLLYVGTTVDVYRRALDLLAAGEGERLAEELPQLMAELRRPMGRGFSTHFLDGNQDRQEAYLPDGGYQDGRARYAGQIVGVCPEGLVLRVQNPLEPGVQLELRDRGLSCELVTLSQLRAPDGTQLDRALTGHSLLVPGRFKAGVGALVRLTPADPGATRAPHSRAARSPAQTPPPKVAT